MNANITAIEDKRSRSMRDCLGGRSSAVVNVQLWDRRSSRKSPDPAIRPGYTPVLLRPRQRAPPRYCHMVALPAHGLNIVGMNTQGRTW